MRYIKLYEEFGDDGLDMVMTRILEDSGVHFDRLEEFCGEDLVVYKVASDEYWQTIDHVQRAKIDQNIKDFGEIVNDLGWTLSRETSRVANLFVFHRGDLKESIKSWLNENYGDLTPVEKKLRGKKRKYYADKSGYPVIFYNESEPRVVYVDAAKLGIGRNPTIFSVTGEGQLGCIRILKEWIGEKYHLTDIDVYINSGGWGNIAGSKINWQEKVA